MATINYNKDIFTNTLIPTAENAKKKLNTAISISEKITYSYGGEIDWARRKNKLNDCLKEIQKYIEWLNEIKRNFSSNTETFKDELNKIKIENIKARNSIVKKT